MEQQQSNFTSLPEDAVSTPWDSSPERFAHLSPHEIVAVSAIAQEYGDDYDDLRGEDFDGMLSSLAAEGSQRAVDVFTAFADSLVAKDRWQVLPDVTALAKSRREVALSLWDRLLRDVDRDVRTSAHGTLEDHFLGIMDDDANRRYEETGNPPSGMHLVAALDEEKLRQRSGLTRADAYNLMLSQAYADNGERYDVRRAALAKLLSVERPA